MKRNASVASIFAIVLLLFFITNTTCAQVIKWSTYLNTTGDDQLQSMVKDRNGDIYILGLTNENGFPVTPGAVQTGLTPNSIKATISKMSGVTGNLIWSTYLGGDGDNIIVSWFGWDSLSNTVILSASSAADNYPVAGGISRPNGSLASAVLTQLNATNGSVVYSTHLFSNKLPVWGIQSTVNNLPVVAYRAIFRSHFSNGYFYAITLDSLHKSILLSKVNAVSHQFEYEKRITINNGTFLPSIGYTPTFDVAAFYLGFWVHNNDVFIAGTTNATDYPTTAGSYQPVYPIGGNDAYFFTRLNPDGTIAFSTFANFSPQSSLVPYSQFAVNNNEVALYTAVGSGINVSPGGFSFNNVAIANRGLLKLNRSNGSLKFFTYVGPLSTYLYPSEIQYSGNGDLFLSGISSSPLMPTTSNAIQPYESYHDPSGFNSPDCYFMHFNSQNQLVYSTYLGGEKYQGISGTFISGDNVYIPMQTSSSNFPVTGNATQLANRGSKGAPASVVVVAGEFALVKYNIPARKITYSGFLGTNVNDAGGALYCDGDIAYIPLRATHYSGKPLLQDFPVSPDAFQKTMTGQNNTNAIANHQYIAKINTVTGKLLYGSYLGSLPISKGEFTGSMIVDNDDIYLAGQSRSNDYPVTQGAVRTTYLDTSDIFVTKLSLCYNDIINDSIFPRNISVCANAVVPVISGSVPEVVNPSVVLRNNIPQTVTGLSNFNYQWQQSTNNILWSNIAGATGKDFQPNPVSATRYFRRIAFGPSCENFDTSNTTAVTLNGFVATKPDAGGNNGSFFACPLNSLQIGSPAVAGLSYTWQPSVNLSDPNSSQTTFNSAVAGAYIYELTATDNNGCTSKDTAVVFNYRANAGADKILCNNNTVLIGGLPLAGAAGITYAWQPAAGLSCSNCAQPLASDTGTFVLTVNLPLPQGGNCTTTDTVVVKRADIATKPAGNDTTICFGQSVVLGTPRVPGFTYNWTPGNFMNAIADTAQPTFNKSRSTLDLLYNPAVYVLTANNPAGCTIIDTVKVYVNYPDVGLSGCRPRQIGRPDNTNGQAVYQWVMADGSPIPAGELSDVNVPNPVALSNPNVPTRTYMLKKTWNGLTCSNTIQVYNNCTCPPVVVKFRSTTGCPVVYDSLTMYVANPSPNYIYTWSPSTGLNTSTGTSVKSGVRTQTHYTVTATSIVDSSFYCGGGEIWVNNSDTTAPIFDVRDTFVCKGQSVSIGLPEVAGLRYDWTTSASNGVVVSTVSDPSVVGDKDLVYYADVFDPGSGCHTYDTISLRVPQVTADAGPSRSSCSGGGFRLGTAAVPGFVYSWFPSEGLTGANTAQPVVVSNTQNVTYILTVQEPFAGCTATDSVTLTHVDNPVLDPLSTPASYCEGSNTSVQIGNPPLDSVTYSWSPATGLSNPNVAQPFANPAVTTTYTLTAQFPGQCAAAATASVMVTVKPKPAVSVSGTSNCNNTQLIITSNAVRPAYAWTPNTALNSATIPNPVSTTSVPVTYTVTVTDLNTGCSNTASYEVMPPVIANAGDDKEICEGSTAEIGLPVQQDATYSWYPLTGLSNFTSVPTTTLSTLPAGTYTYYLTATINGCSKTDSVKVKVNALPLVAQPYSLAICNGASVQIGAASEPGVTYSWSPVTGLSSTNIANPVASPRQTTVYTVTATNALTGCIAVSSVTVVVNNQASPVITISKSCINPICPGDSIRLTANVSGSGNFTYVWTPAASIATSPNIKNPVVKPTETTTYTVFVANCSNSCVTSAQTTVIVKDTCNNSQLTVLPVQWLLFTAVWQKGKTMLHWKVGMEQDNKEFIVERSSDALHWGGIFTVPAFANNSGAGDYTAEDMYPLNGVSFYRIRQIDKNGKESVSIVRSIITGKIAPEFVVYPNPVNNGMLNYALLNANNNTKLRLQLFDTEGRLVKTVLTVTASGYFTTGELTPGMYILQMTDNYEHVANKKVLVQR